MDSQLREMCIENRKTEVEPALVLAYDFYEDPDREAEIIARNNIRHGGFVPAKDLNLLSR